MGKKTKKPQIRFAGFTDDWEQRKAVDIADYSKGNGYSKSDLTEIGTPIILYGRLYTKYQFAISEVDTFATPKDGSVYSQGNEVIIPASGETAEDIARASAVEKSGILLGGDLNILRPFNFINPLFLALTISSGEPQKELAKKAQGKSVVHIHNSDIQEVSVSFPTRAEQDRIVAVFRHLDNLITLHQRKLSKLKNIKKSMLEKMFPQNSEMRPEIRFAGFTDDWEQRKLGATNTFFTDGNYGEAYPKSSDMTDSGSGIPFLTGGNLKDGKLSLDGASYITPEKHSKLTSGHLLEDDIVIAVRGSLGALGYVNTDNSGWNINSQLAILRTDKSELYGKFLIQYLLSWTGQNELLKRQTGSALKQLPIGAIKDVEVPITSIAEQGKIGEYFSNLDNLITLHQRKLEKLKMIKRLLLEKMFI